MAGGEAEGEERKMREKQVIGQDWGKRLTKGRGPGTTESML